MSLRDYATAQDIAAGAPSLNALLMAAMTTATAHDARRLEAAFPLLWDELQSRRRFTDGRLYIDRMPAWGGRR